MRYSAAPANSSARTLSGSIFRMRSVSSRVALKSWSLKAIWASKYNVSGWLGASFFNSATWALASSALPRANSRFTTAVCEATEPGCAASTLR